MLNRRTVCWIGVATVLVACGSSPGRGGSVGGGWLSSGLSEPLEKQRKLMAQTFAGTGVEVGVTADKALKITVPTKYSFDAGKYAVKPQLTKVMERLGPGVARNPAAVLQIWAPVDDKAPAGLLAERRDSLRDMAIAYGVPLSRIQVSTDGAPGGAVTELLVSEKRR